MAKDQGLVSGPTRRRASVVEDEGPRFNLLDSIRGLPKFAAEVRAEARKVTWTSWRETWITSVMVGVMVILTSLFFFLVDAFFSFATSQLLKLGGSGS
jgi:preprotein translocase subunit SecE